MSKESTERYELLLAELQQQLAELEIRQETRKGIATSAESQIFSLKEQIEEIKYKIFSIKYPGLRSYQYYIRLIPDLAFFLILIAAIFWGSIYLLKSSEILYFQIVLNFICVFSVTAILYIASRRFRNAWKKQKKYEILSTIAENSSLFREIEREISSSIHNETES